MLAYVCLCVTKDRVEGGSKVQTPFKGVCAGLSSLCVFMFKCVRCDVHSWYCSNLLGGEEKTVRTELKQKTVT